MLKQTTRERLQAVIRNPEFPYISVDISDKKMFHASGKGEPTFYVDINIHTEGESGLDTLLKLIPEIAITERTPSRVEHSDHISVGECARGALEGAEVNFWSTFYKIPLEKPSAPTESPKEISHPDCTINVTKVESLLEPWTLEQITRNEARKCVNN